MNRQKLFIRIFRFVMNTLFKERSQKSAIQYSSGPGMSTIKLLGLTWKRNTHKHINPKQLQQKINRENGFVLLDIRARKAFDEGHIANAVNIPLRKLLRAEDFPFSKGAEIIVICYLGITSREAITILAEQGYKNLTNMDGGMGAWDYEKEQTVRAR